MSGTDVISEGNDKDYIEGLCLLDYDESSCHVLQYWNFCLVHRWFLQQAS